MGLAYLLASCALALSAVGSAFAAEPIVIVLSWDGVRHDYLDRSEWPALGRIERDGLRAERLVPVFPTNTFANHSALATGAHTDRHGIVDNVFWDRERGLYSYSKDGDWLDAEPIWATAERQGVRAASFFWVASETDWRGTAATYRITPFDGEIGEDVKVDQIFAWLDLPAAERPRLIMSWWHGADAVGHLKGPNHPEIVEQLSEQDTHLARLLAGMDERELWGHTTLLLVSDHGMTEVNEVVAVREPLEAAGIDARVIPSGASASVYLNDPEQLEAARAVLRQIPNVDVYSLDTIPSALRVAHPKRTGDLFVVTPPPRTFYQSGFWENLLVRAGALVLDWRPGMHGYTPDHPDMSAILLAMGRGVTAGTRIGAVPNIDVAPTIAKLLGIEPPAQAEGKVIDAFEVD